MEPQLSEEHGVRIAVEGCGHGTLHAIYASIERACVVKGWPGVDLLIIGGDFQSVRNAHDLQCVSMPAKYREMHDFHEYYSGARKAPYLTIFVGGNHEAANYLFELYYGGWVAPNIYYMGAANVLKLGPLRIAGMSGIWKGFDYKKQHFERLPYNEGDVKSIYHVRELDVRKLLQIRTQVDVGISHDWPRGVEWKGDWKKLFRQKAHLEEDARNGQLGSVAATYVMDRLRPPYWFSAHLHCKYAAVIDHENPGQASDSTAAASNEVPVDESIKKNSDEIDLDMDDEATPAPVQPTKNTDEIDLDMNDDEAAPTSKSSESVAVLPVNADEIDLELEDDTEPTTAPVAPGQGLDGARVPIAASTEPTTTASTVPEDLRAQLPASFARPPPRPESTNQPISHPPGITNTKTHFLALDKCLPNRDFLQVLSMPAISDPTASPQRPLQLEYDTEWLAITRVFASELNVGGDPNTRAPPDLGEAHYAPLIDTAETWIKENVKDMTIPQNFEITAPIFDPAAGIHVQGAPKEYTNNQTSRFCEMLEISNPFDISEEEREERMRVGPRPDEQRRDGGFRGGRGGGGRGGGRGRGNGRGRGGHGGRGRGRGRGGPRY
ncbi:DBR1-domain-containing protein, partial [Aureobasidium melanogenum]|uniref:DBR1-domain-containing protein n=1 Tax=Aureobasidium melanogenum (strain CBS 110374) TaxID=1043003 RepID=A0A074VGN3_AURM1